MLSYADEKRAMLDTAQDIAAHLPGWSVDTDPDWSGRPRLLHTDGRSLLISAQRYNKLDRIEIMGGGPYPGRVAITVAVSRGGKNIAADITRRLLPAYNAARADQAVNDAAKADAAAGRAATMARLSGIVGLRECTHTSGKAYFSAPNQLGDVEVSNDGSSVSLDLRYLTVDRAAAVLAVVAGFEALCGSYVLREGKRPTKCVLPYGHAGVPGTCQA